MDRSGDLAVRCKMLIKAYGEMWNPEIVNWGSRGKGNSGTLLGKVSINGKKLDVDFWSAVGMYVLYDDFRPVYVGKAFGTLLGPRLRNHLTDRLVGRWDMFSWYSMSTVNSTSKSVRTPGQRQIKPDTILNTLEAISIAITDPPLNRKKESLPDAIEAIQVGGSPKALRTYLEEIQDKLDQWE